MKRIASALAVFSLLLLPMAIHAGAAEETYYPFEFQAVAEQPLPDVALMSLPVVGTFDPENPSYKAQLEDEIAIAAYEALETGLAPGVERIEISLDGMSYSSWSGDVFPALQAAVAAFVYDHPESQYCTISGYGSTATSDAFLSIVQHEDAARRKAALDCVLEDFSASFDATLPVMEQYRAIHDYVCDLAAYNYTAASSSVITEAHKAYGLLVDGDKVVCEGYSKSFKLLCDAVGLPCMLIAGEGARSGQFSGYANHMWNAVCIDGEWYAVDVTWDDIDGYELSSVKDIELSLTTYDYFLQNAPFLEDSGVQDHRATGNIYFAHSFPMTFSLPQLAEGFYPGVSTVSTDHLGLTFTGDNLTIPSILWRYNIDGVPLSTIRNLTLTLTQDLTLTQAVSVPSGWTYTLDDQGYTLSAGESYDGALFLVSGTLKLSGDVPADCFTLNSSGTLHITGQLLGCLDYECGTLNLNGETITEDRHISNGICTPAEGGHVSACMCGATSLLEPHILCELTEETFLVSGATCTASAVYDKSCSVCGAVSDETFSSGEPLPHSYNSTWQMNSLAHWHECGSCGSLSEKVEHSDADGDLLCDSCAYDLTPDYSCIRSVSDGKVVFQVGKETTSVVLAAAQYADSKMTDLSFYQYTVTPGQTVEQSIPFSLGNIKVFLLSGNTLIPLCPDS